MRKYNLNIAGYNIRFESAEGGPDFMPAARFLMSLTDDNNSDLLIRVHSGPCLTDKNSERVFHAPFVEEINGSLVENRPDFWSIWKLRSDLYIKTIFPLTQNARTATLKFSLTSTEWDLWFDGINGAVDPFEYPLDGLILYYLTVINGDILIHASGVCNNGKGYLFSGVSGKGKTTMAKIWENSGARVIHDDRLIIRSTGSDYYMYNTPVYNNDEPRKSQLHRIYIIEHGERNTIVPLKGAAAISHVVSNCIQHTWGSEIIARLLGSVSIMTGKIPVAMLGFRPDRHIIDHIMEHE